MKRFFLDKFMMLLIAAIIVASIFPVSGIYEEYFSIATKFAVGLLFFMHGARLSRQSVVAGFVHWRLHLVVLLITFALFPIIGWGLGWAIPGLKNNIFYAGILFLCLLPSTVQSSIAFTSIARGNVPAAVVSASASNIFGMFITPLLVGIFLTAQGKNGISLDAIWSILLQLLAPFILGQMLQPFIGTFMVKHHKTLSKVDRSSILMVVYLAFSETMTQGLWSKVSWNDLTMMIIADVILLAIVMILTNIIAHILKFNDEDRIAILFCGSKKSLASGAPMANAIFAGQNIGLMVMPLMIFHQIQLMVCAVLAQYYAHQFEKKKLSKTEELA